MDNLLTELTNWIEDYKDAAERNALAENPDESAKYLISKAREAVEGAENPYPMATLFEYFTDPKGHGRDGFETCRQAILKALGGE